MAHGLWLGAILFVVGLGGFITGSDLGSPDGQSPIVFMISGPVIIVVGGLAAAASVALSKRLPPTWVYRFENGWRNLLAEVSRDTYGWRGENLGEPKNHQGRHAPPLLMQEEAWRKSHGL